MLARRGLNANIIFGLSFHPNHTPSLASRLQLWALIDRSLEIVFRGHSPQTFLRGHLTQANLWNQGILPNVAQQDAGAILGIRTSTTNSCGSQQPKSQDAILSTWKIEYRIYRYSSSALSLLALDACAMQ